jgi:Na+/H+ antiporter NhaD/arsenite permease-like protein
VIEPLWWLLSLGARLDGNGTLTGVGAFGGRGHRRTHGSRFGFMRYLAYGAPLTLVSIAIC